MPIALTFTVPNAAAGDQILALCDELGIDAAVRTVQVKHYGDAGGSHWNVILTASAGFAAVLLRRLHVMFGSLIKVEIPGRLSVSVRSVDELQAVQKMVHEFLEQDRQDQPPPRDPKPAPAEQE